jgi:hypothetical protein
MTGGGVKRCFFVADHSLRSDLTGSRCAAFNACVVTINSANAGAVTPVSGKAHDSMLVRIVYRVGLSQPYLNVLRPTRMYNDKHRLYFFVR